MKTIYTDSAVRGNPSDKGAWSFFVVKENGSLATSVCEVRAGGVIPGKVTNNIAEYYAIIEAAKYAETTGLMDVKFRSDSSLAVNQLLGKFKVKNSGIIPYYEEALKQFASLEYVEVEWVPRENPWLSRVDAYCNKILDTIPAPLRKLELLGKDF